MSARPPNPWPVRPCSLKDMHIEVAMIRPKTHDPDPLMESDIFGTRRDFLNLCQGRRFQFDELRRAKHSTMMILYHLQNPDAEAFTHVCNNCNAEIVGERRQCTTCDDYSLCLRCIGRVAHTPGHVFESHGGSGRDAAARAADSQLNQLQLELLVHTANCPDSTKCGHPFCAKMRQFSEHTKVCSVKVQGGCAMCKKFWAMLSLHVKQCRRVSCPVVYCEKLKRHVREQANLSSDRRMLALLRSNNPAPAADPTVDAPSAVHE
jgi:E1A/CREB-binding protein